MPAESALSSFVKWYTSLKQVRANNGPAIGTIAAGLVVLERLKNEYKLDLDAHLAPSGTQIAGASGASVAAILRQFDEVRPFAKEGGRTNRGLLAEIEPMLSILETLQLGRLELEERNETLTAFQAYLVDRVKDFHNRQKLRFEFDPGKSTWQTIFKLLHDADEERKSGPVAQHLVGAKLQLRFPDIRISNESANTADAPTDRGGDFQIRDTIFHVTVAPMIPVFEKCNQNLRRGFRPFLLVPDAKLVFARQTADELCGGKVSVESLETFVSQNIEELGEFSVVGLKDSLIRLINIYNTRVDEVEVDKSLMIELPSNLRSHD
jgi:hypothetical protein